MQTLLSLKEAEATSAPLLLFNCVFSDGSERYWCTQQVTISGKSYEPRVCRNNLFEVQTASDQGVDTIPKLTLELANADALISELDRTKGFKGARLTCSFVFYDLVNQVPEADPVVLFLGIFNSPEIISETTLRVSAINRLSAQRVVLPSLRVQRRCAWNFPATATDRAEAVSGGARGEQSRFYSCGYSADQPGGVGNLNGAACFDSCSFTRKDCEARGMFNTDSQGNKTARFSGIEFVPSTITVRSAGEKGSHTSALSVNEARYNDFVPLVYGSAWYTPSIVFARNDGNLTRMEILLGVGEMQDIHKVLVSDIEIPLGHSGLNMTGTGWFNIVTLGGRTGAFNTDFTTASGTPLGDPYGSMAMMSVVVPNRINDGKTLPQVKVLADGLKLARFDSAGAPQGKAFSSNPVWIILDILLRNGWNAAEFDLTSFATTAEYCDEMIGALDLHKNPVQIPRFQCNLILANRRSAGDVLRGIRNSSRLFLTFGTNGLLQVRSENTVAAQQPILSGLSNATLALNGGWPLYEFGDGTLGTSGILRNTDGSSSLRLSSRGAPDTPNRMSIEFQDAFNEFQQDSFSLSDPDDIGKAGQEINSTPAVLGIPNYHQAARTLQFLLNKSVNGNLQVEFQTSVKAVGIVPGDIIALTYLREGFERQPFRVTKIAPGQNFRSTTITAQLHDDSWYSDVILTNFGLGRRLPSATLGLPRPLSGVKPDDFGVLQFQVTESATVAQDGTASVMLDVVVATPPAIADHAPAIPIVGLTPEITALAGGLEAGKVFYYAVSGLDAKGDEGLLSFVLRALIPTSGGGFSVTLNKLSFSSDTVSFHVYRGLSPVQLNRVATSISIASTFTDNGLPALAILPPDVNFHHSNLYWRLESEGEVNAALHSPLSIGNVTLRMALNVYAGSAVRILRGTGAGQERVVVTNTQTELMLTTPWDIEPDATSVFVVSQAAFQNGGSGPGTNFQFEVPNREATVVQILGLSANAANAECPAQISPVTRWKIGGAGIRTIDADVPGIPSFALDLTLSLNGTLELRGVSFASLINTATIVAGTLTVYSQDELTTAAPVTVSSALDQNSTTLVIKGDGIQKGVLIRLGQELVRVADTDAMATVLTIYRALYGTTAANYETGEQLVLLQQNTVTVPFIRNFFGTPASGSWSYSVPLENSRVTAAEFFVTNSQGNSPIATQTYLNTIDRGLRTLSGGQYSVQVAGPLAVETGAAPDIVLETDHVIGDITAYLGVAASGSAARIQVNVNDVAICTLQIDAGYVESDRIRGADMAALRRGDRLSVDVLAIGSTLPGTDLTVVVRI